MTTQSDCAVVPFEAESWPIVEHEPEEIPVVPPDLMLPPQGGASRFPYVWAWRQSAHRVFDRCRRASAAASSAEAR